MIETKAAECFPLVLDAQIATTGIILKLANTTFVIPDVYSFVTGECTQVKVTVRFPTTGGAVQVASPAGATVHADTDGDLSVTFHCSSPDEIDIEVGITTTAPRGAELRPKPGVPSRSVKLAPKIGYPPPTSGDE